MFIKFNKPLLGISIFFCLAFSQASTALESDSSAPIHIEADHVNLDQSKGIALYKGNVSLKQGSINISADSIEVYAKDGQLDHANIEGKNKPARFEQMVQPGQLMIGEALHIHVQQNTSEITFKGNATVDDGLNKISGGIIRYNSEKHKIIANNEGSSSGRVKMIFLPPKQTTEQ